MSIRSRLGLDPSQMRITRGAMILLFAEIGMTLVWLLSPLETRKVMDEWLRPSYDTVFEHGRVWTLVTGSFIEASFLGIILHAIMLSGFAPTLERFWGTNRFLRFAAITQLLGALACAAMGFATGVSVFVDGLSPFTWALVVAFGIIYARQPVQVWGVLPLTGRQMMFGFMAFLALMVVLGQQWNSGASWGAAMLAAAVMVSKRWSPGLAWKRWRISRARRKLTVMQGGVPSATKPKRRADDQRFIN